VTRSTLVVWQAFGFRKSAVFAMLRLEKVRSVRRCCENNIKIEAKSS